MPILSISRNVFDQLHPRRATSWMFEEVEWFAERSRMLIGYIARRIGPERDPQSEDWTMVIEGRDERGEFHVVDSREQIATQSEARTVLEKRVNELLATGVKVFPRNLGALRS